MRAARPCPPRGYERLAVQHGVRSAGIATPDDWLRVARRHAPRARMVGLDPRRFPHDIATLARYGPSLQKLPDAQHPWTPPSIDTTVEALAGDADIDVTTDH